MNQDKTLSPDNDPNETIERQKTTRKSFVRIPANRRKNPKPSPSTVPINEARVLEAELIDENEEEDQEDDDDIEIIDIPIEGEDSDLPALREHTADLETLEEEEEPQVEDKGLVVASGLSRYLAEIRRYPLLTPEEERALGIASWDHGDVNAKKHLVTSNLRLVVKIVMEYRRAYSQILDLIQEGNAGLVQAVNRFNPYKGVKLSTYSAWWIRAYVLKFLMDNKSLVRMGTTDAQRKLFFRLRSEAEKMYALTQRFDARLLAENIGVKEADVIEMQERLTKNDVSLDTPIGEDGDARQIDLLVSQTQRADEKVAKDQILKLIRAEMTEIEKELNERDLYIFRNRIIAEEPITLQEVGEKYQITRERARQLEARIIKKVRERLIAKGIKSDFITN